MNKLEKVTEFVNKHTDEQCGLDIAYVDVFLNFGNITICVGAKKLPSKEGRKRIRVGLGSMNDSMKADWKCQAEDLIEELGKDPHAGYGGLGYKFELDHLHNTGFHLRGDVE